MLCITALIMCCTCIRLIALRITCTYVLLDRSDFKDLCTRCGNDTTDFKDDSTMLFLPAVRAFPELKSPPILLISPFDMYALIEARRQVKFSPLLGLLAFLTLGDMNTKKLKRP